MHRKIPWIAAMLAILLLAGCHSVTVRVDYDPKTEFAQFRTYAWAPPTENERQEQARNSLMHERIVAAVEAHLTARGYSQAAIAQADFLVTHSVTVERRTAAHDARISIGYGHFGRHGGIGIGTGFPIGGTVEEYQVGTLIIDIIDARQQRLVWRGAGDRALGDDGTPEENTRIVNNVVNKILDRFPPAPTSSR